jgi:Family of unknown function (DUF6519)/Right handed beta helix region
MSADISRVRFDPLRDFAGVVLQQGRLLLDADFNELVALLDRRLRAETSDLTSFGPDPDHAGVAWVPRQTPDAFRVTLSGGTLSIGRGRMYVDGLLAENHGTERRLLVDALLAESGGTGLKGFDPLLSERTGSEDTPYDEQPYWKTPDPLPTDGTHLVYLDVWQREVTHIEDPDLVEIAVGVDTTARLQTAWQVRVLEPDDPGITCSTADEDILGWPKVIRPSDGRLTNDTVEVEDKDDPCALPPGSGYRGLENQTYRVEIHEGGEPGKATFKWSRENASVVLPVVEMVSPTTLRLASVGKDEMLRISTGDWVEILDDNFELDGKPGDMRQVTVHDAERTITFTDALTAELQPANPEQAAARHLRVRRWDQAGKVLSADGTQLTDLEALDSSGLITVPASDTTQVLLEHGIVASFAVAETDGIFRAGDYWVFAARTADASIEPVDEAPPLGVHHHYARLAVITFPDTEISCRRLWPPLPTEGGEACDCSVCVTPESHSSGLLTVQSAVDQVKAEGGGTVCLAVGVYDLPSGVEVDGTTSMRIRGQGLATKLVAAGEALTITNSLALTVENLAIVSGAGSSAAVRLRGVALADLHDLGILSYGSEEGGGSAIELGGVEFFVSMRRNVLVARTGIGVPAGTDEIGMFAGGLRIEDNVIVGFERGIDLGGASAYVFACRVSGNDVLGPSKAGLRATGAVGPGGALDLVGNKLVTRGAGVIVGADGVVDSNTIEAWGSEAGTHGIVVDAGPIALRPGDVRITGNRIRDRAGFGIALRTSVRTFMVKQNVLETVGQGIVIGGKGRAQRVAVDNNELFDVATVEGFTNFVVGILVSHATSAAVMGNTVVGVGSATTAAQIGGIMVISSESVQIAGNFVDEIGPQEGFDGHAVGIEVIGPFEHTMISQNTVRFGPDQPGPLEGNWNALLIESHERMRSRVNAGKAVVQLDNGALVVDGIWAVLVEDRGDHVTVGSNMLAGGGEQPACFVRVTGSIVAEANQCLYVAAEDPLAAADVPARGVVLNGSSVVASSNRLRGDKAMLILEVQKERFAAVGNLAPGGTHLGSATAGLPPAWEPLNPPVS